MLFNMSNPSIVRVPLHDSEDFVLIRASQRSKSSGLDLRLVATEGEAVYKASVKESNLDKLRAKNNRASDEEWSAVLSYVLGQKASVDNNDWIKGLDISAIVVPSEDDDEQGEIRVTLRKRVGGISQRLGVITLSQSDEEISLFDWAGTAVLQSETLHEELSSLREAVSTAEETSKKLQKQLDDFLSEKQQHDEQMMAKFAGLLNEKKLKIRNQQRLLSSLNVSPDKANDLDPEIKAEASSLPPTSSKPQSRKTKRQRDAKSTSDGEASDKMDVDEAAEKDEETQSDDDGHATPQPLEEDDVETASEDEA